MDFQGQYLFLAPRADVWAALNDADMLRAAIPGCQSLTWVTESSLEAAISVDLGVVKPRFAGDLFLSDVDPAKSYTLTGRGRGGLLGLAGGEARITLADHRAGCILAFGATGSASGSLMKLGRTLLGSSAQRVIDRFFERFGGAMQVQVTPMRNPPE